MGEVSVVTAVVPSLKFGAACGCAGFLFGGTSGILKATTPFLFATASGIQTFALGTTFWACRSTYLRTRLPGSRTSSDYTKASSLAGGLSGGFIGLITRGRRNVLPAALMWSLLGAAGQVTANSFAARPKDEEPKKPLLKRMAESRWSPFTFISDADYAEVLREKALKVDVEIAMLDDKIATLRKMEIDEAAKEATPKTESTP